MSRRTGLVLAHHRCVLQVVIASIALAVIVFQPVAAQTYDPEARLTELGIVLPDATISSPRRAYDLAVQTGNLVFLSGHAPCGEWGGDGRGKVPSEVTLEQAQASARQVAICLLASLKAHVGDLNRVGRIVRVFGMVNADPDFTGHSTVMNAASELFNDVFGERGRHVRAAVGMGSLPANLTVEIEMVVEVEGDAVAGAPGEMPASAATVDEMAGGFFALAQAGVGAEVFDRSCLECHDVIEMYGPDFLFEWQGSSVGRLLRVIRETMPDDTPGSLSNDDYLAVVAYILELNGLPPGPAALPALESVLDELVIAP